MGSLFVLLLQEFSNFMGFWIYLLCKISTGQLSFCFVFFVPALKCSTYANANIFTVLLSADMLIEVYCSNQIKRRKKRRKNYDHTALT